MSSSANYITKDTLLNVIKNRGIVDQYYDSLISEMDKGAINTKNRVSSFLAEILHESSNLTATKENLNYTAAQLVKTWPHLFKTLDFAKAYEHNPEKTANLAYGGRLGNVAPGDGWKYRGRGLMQTTGKDNYSQLSKDTGVDFVNHPELLEQPKYAVMSAVNFWVKKGLNALADAGNFSAITQKINGGQIGEADREGRYQQLLSLVKENPVKVSIGALIFFFAVAYVAYRFYKAK